MTAERKSLRIASQGLFQHFQSIFHGVRNSLVSVQAPLDTCDSYDQSSAFQQKSLHAANAKVAKAKAKENEAELAREWDAPDL